MIRTSYRLAAPTLLGLLIALLGLVIAAGGSPTQAQGAPPLDHFKCYRTLGSIINEPVQLKDQFDDPTQPVNARVVAALRFCNPVAKFHLGAVTPIANPDAHLKLYFIQTAPNPPRQVVINNQFGLDQRLDVSQAVVLAVPAQKEPHPLPVGLDHFKCYRADGAPSGAFVGLRDQFRTEFPVRVVQPFLFCNPTEKTDAAGVVTPILNPEGHLVCYRILSQTSSGTVVNTHDQFIDETLALNGSDMLCTPSQKLSETVTFHGFDVTTLGQAHVHLAPTAPVESHERLVVSNIGSSGEDGVSIDFSPVEPIGFQVPWMLDFDDGAAPYVETSAFTGLELKSSSRVIGKSGELITDFSPAGSSTQTVEVYDDGVLVAQLRGHPNNTVAAMTSNLPMDVGFRITPAACEWHYGFDNEPIMLPPFNGVEGVAVIGDRLVLRAEDVPPMEPTFLSEGRVQAADFPALAVFDVFVELEP